MAKEKKKRSSLEREVIAALTLLYTLIMGAVLVFHYMPHPVDAPPAQKIEGKKP